MDRRMLMKGPGNEDEGDGVRRDVGGLVQHGRERGDEGRDDGMLPVLQVRVND